MIRIGKCAQRGKGLKRQCRSLGKQNAPRGIAAAKLTGGSLLLSGKRLLLVASSNGEPLEFDGVVSENDLHTIVFDSKELQLKNATH